MAEYINKSTLLRSFAPIYKHDRYTGLTFETAKQIITDHINSFPTVDAEPVRHGHWVRNDNGTYSCSECQSWIPNEQHYYARYCLHCGAKMDGGENETNAEY